MKALRDSSLRGRRVRGALALTALTALLGAACARGSADVRQQLQVADVTTGWYDAGIVEGGKNKLVPTISFALRNGSDQAVSVVQLNAVFRRVGEQEEWGTAFARAVGTEGLPPSSSTKPIVLHSQLGYTSEEPRAQMFQHSEFKDARVELFVKRGSEQWTKLGEFPVKRQLLTQ